MTEYRILPDTPPLRMAVVDAAISWSVHHTPITGPHDKSPAADRARAVYRVESERKLHAAVRALFEEIDAKASA